MINPQMNATPVNLNVGFPPVAPSATAEASEATVADPQDSVSLSQDALAYVDPDEAGKNMGEIGKVVGAAAGGAIGVAAPSAIGQPEAGLLLGPIGITAGTFVGQGAGYVVGAGTAHAVNAVESTVRGVGNVLEAGGNAINGAYRWVMGR